MLSMLTQGWYVRRVLLAALADAGCFLLATGLARMVVHPPFEPYAYAAAAIAGCLLAITALVYCGAYSSSVVGSARDTLHSVVLAMGLAFVAALLVYFVLPVPMGFVQAAAHTALFFFPLVLMQRAVFRSISSRRSQRVIVIGAGDLAATVVKSIHQRPRMGLQLVGVLLDDDAMSGERFEGYPVLGRAADIEKLRKDLGVERIIVAIQARSEPFPEDALLDAKLDGCRVDSGLVFLEQTLGRVFVRRLRPSYLIFSEGFRHGTVPGIGKRTFDIAVAGVFLILALPVLALAVIAIRAETPGPGLYRQARVGRGGRLFRVVKLRTMEEDAEAETGARYADRDDERVTRLGNLLRRTRLDEVPQLWNVLCGEMSMVGPRPERPEFVEELNAKYPLFRLRTAVKPGVTGWAQVRYGYVNDFESAEHKLALDLFYLKHRSLALDLLILWSTVKTIVLFRGV
jgi:sugar transferase (PEP-CTERM system associated)